MLGAVNKHEKCSFAITGTVAVQLTISGVKKDRRSSSIPEETKLLEQMLATGLHGY
jgi:hypothetical protein